MRAETHTDHKPRIFLVNDALRSSPALEEERPACVDETCERPAPETARIVAHLDLDSFFVAVERVLDPSLKGKPVVVGGDPSGRGVVASASYEARRYGIHSAMPAGEAKRRCPQLIFVRGNFEAYKRASEAVGKILERCTPLVEWASIDEAYLELTGTERLFGAAVETADKLRRAIERRLRLSASIGIGTNKLIAKIASNRCKPRGLMQVFPGKEEAFLAPLPVGELPGIGPRMQERLRFLGVRTLGELRRLDPQALGAVFGSLGPWLVARAAGRDCSPVARDTDPKSVSRETTFPDDTNDRALLEEILFRLCGEVGSRLRGKSLRGRTVTLKIRYADFHTITRSVTARRPLDLDHEIYAAALKLMEAALNRRVRVRLLGVGLTNLEVHARQLDLFASSEQRQREALTLQVDAIRRRYGYEAIAPARILPGEDH